MEIKKPKDHSEASTIKSSTNPAHNSENKIQTTDSSLLNIKRQRAAEVKDIDKPGKNNRQVEDSEEESEENVTKTGLSSQNKKIRETIQYVNNMFDSKRDLSKPLLSNKHGKR